MALKKTNKTKSTDLKADNIKIIRDTSISNTIVEPEVSNVVPLRKPEGQLKQALPIAEPVTKKPELSHEGKTTIDPKKFCKVYVGTIIIGVVALFFII